MQTDAADTAQGGRRAYDGAAPRAVWPTRYTLVGLCFLASFICYIDRVNISVAIIAMRDTFGWSETTKGIVLSSFFIGYMGLQIASGWLAKRIGGRWVLGSAVLWWSLFTILTPPAAFLSLGTLIAARIGMGLGESAMYPAAYAMFSRWIPETERSRTIALTLSGIPLGTLFALTTAGWIVAHWGWPSVFYLFGLFGLVWAAFWFATIHDDPRRHPRISAQERALLEPLQHHADVQIAVPWRKLLARLPVIALVIAHFCSNWALYVLLAWLPSYFRDAQHVSITSAGLYSAAPWLTMFLMSNVAGWSADGLLRRGVSNTTVRKLMQSIGLVGSGGFLLLAQWASSAPVAMLIMCGALGCLAFCWAGYACNHHEIAPRYASVLIGFTNTFATIPGIIGVAVTGWLVDVTGTYAAAFVLTAVVNVTGTLIWVLFGTSKKIID